MKNIVASVGLIAIGATAMQNASAQNLALDQTKPWSVAATLRGFYDDNTATLADNQALPAGQHKGSFGFEVSPSLSFAWNLEQTTFRAGYLFSYKYFDNEIPYTTDKDSLVHTFNLSLTHQFNERYQVALSDSFVVGQEPDLLRAGNTFSTFQRISGDNIRNHGSIALDAQFTPTFGANLGYDNALYRYDAGGPTVVGGQITPSPVGSLDRIEHAPHIEGTWLLQPETKALLGYRFREIDYTGDELIAGTVTPFGVLAPVMSRDRDNREHTVYVGGQHSFRPDLTASVRVGASVSDYFNQAGAKDTWTPYVAASLRFNYLPDSYIEGGFSYDRNSTDLVGATGLGTFTMDAESASIYAAVNHHFTPKLVGNVMGQFQNSTYNGGLYNDDSEQYYLAGVSLEYLFNPHFSAQVGYNYDKLDSGLTAFPRTFDRNRVYIGVTARY